ncbi:MAG: hypothetical protein SVV03_02765 [Candidatus Nanohaloarchaea archaeon]|nr:hypothetical protein [Candidatus Nanohaloarchaea archaeon]
MVEKNERLLREASDQDYRLFRWKTEIKFLANPTEKNLDRLYETFDCIEEYAPRRQFSAEFPREREIVRERRKRYDERVRGEDFETDIRDLTYALNGVRGHNRIKAVSYFMAQKEVEGSHNLLIDFIPGYAVHIPVETKGKEEELRKNVTLGQKDNLEEPDSYWSEDGEELDVGVVETVLEGVDTELFPD